MGSPESMGNVNAHHDCISNFLLVEAYEIIRWLYRHHNIRFFSSTAFIHPPSSPLVHCMSRLELPQQPHSRPFPQWPSRPDPGQQSKQQSFSFPRLWIWTPTNRPAITASKPTTTSFSPRGYTNTPRWPEMFDTQNNDFRPQFRKNWIEYFNCSCFGQKHPQNEFQAQFWKKKKVLF